MVPRWFRFPVVVLAALIALNGCGDDEPSPDADPGTTFDDGSGDGAEVFGVRVVTGGASDSEVAVITEMLGDLLDADGNGRADAAAVESELLAASVTIVAKPSDVFSADYDPSSATLVLGGVLDGGRLTILSHIDELIYRRGWSRVFDDLYGIRVGSDLAHAMDQARGGRFEAVPQDYPVGAWYTQSREGCMYRCQLIEYFFHVHMTLLGEYEDADACLALRDVWQTCTSEALRARDPLAFEALSEREAGLVDLQP